MRLYSLTPPPALSVSFPDCWYNVTSWRYGSPPPLNQDGLNLSTSGSQKTHSLRLLVPGQVFFTETETKWTYLVVVVFFFPHMDSGNQTQASTSPQLNYHPSPTYSFSLKNIMMLSGLDFKACEGERWGSNQTGPEHGRDISFSYRSSD